MYVSQSGKYGTVRFRIVFVILFQASTSCVFKMKLLGVHSFTFLPCVVINTIATFILEFISPLVHTICWPRNFDV